MGSIWPQLGPRNGANIVKKSITKSTQTLMPFKVGFDSFLKIFGGRMEASWPNIDPKSILISKTIVFENHRFPKGKTMILKVLRVEAATKNRSKFHQKMHSKFYRFLDRFWEAFWAPLASHLAPKIAPKIDPGRP